MSLDYATVSLWGSALAVAVLLIDTLIAVVRAQKTETVVSPRAELSFVVVILLIAVATLIGSLTIDNPELANVAKFVGSVIRGIVLSVGLYLALFYWSVRRTWLR